MYRKTGFLIVFLFIATSVLPQQPMSTMAVDSETYSLWMAGDWDGLIRLGKEATQAGIDFYYLQYRLGVAYYNKRNYHMAIRHLHRAWRDNPDDPVLQEYLYFANLFSNRRQEARIVAESMKAEQKGRLGIQAVSGLETAEAWYNHSLPDTDEAIGSFPPATAMQGDGMQFIPKEHQYYALFLLHPLSSKVSVYHGYTHIQKNHFIFGQTSNAAWISETAPSTLNQYYASGIIRVKRNLEVISGVHYINIRYPVEVTVNRGQQTFIATVYESMNDISGSLSLYKYLSKFTLGGSFHMATLGDFNQMQGDFSLAFYPLGNLNLYLTSCISMQRETGSGSGKTFRQVFNQQIGAKIARPLWLEVFFDTGDMKNHIRNNGVLVYNTMDAITQQSGGKMMIALADRFYVSAQYTRVRHQSNFLSSSNQGLKQNERTYFSHSFTGGITWVF